MNGRGWKADTSPGRPAGAGRRGPQKTRWRTADQVLGGLEGRACSGVHPERREAGSRGWFGTHHAPPTQSPATAPPGAGNPGSGRGQTRARAVAAGCAPPLPGGRLEPKVRVPSLARLAAEPRPGPALFRPPFSHSRGLEEPVLSVARGPEPARRHAGRGSG